MIKQPAKLEPIQDVPQRSKAACVNISCATTRALTPSPPPAMSDDGPPPCCICLNAFTSPVSIPCGHRFCLACIGEYWRLHPVCQCPLCKASFPTRPQLSPAHTTQGDATRPGASASGSPPPRPGEVPCDVCAGRRRAAIKSCLVCLECYCEAHLEPHYRDAALWRHQLVSVWKDLEEAVCRVHGRRLDRFCRSDQTCVCAMCAREDHRGHRVVSVAKEAVGKKVKLKRSMSRVHQVIQEHQKKVEEIKQSLEDASRVGQVARRQGEGLVKDLEQEVAELQRRSTELEQLSHTEDPLHLLQRFPSFSSPPHVKDWSHSLKSLFQELREKLEIS
ncbi:E3 ubiquitin-protein ligase TRIM47-like isoform X1 [Osmerus mordax]|uniref:E3 ubiquitin-protein ligase TRIM47-like isoform X1 n=2 Tax=Osmerus mordax TaxID=8014 RepID=UPI00350FE1AF